MTERVRRIARLLPDVARLVADLLGDKRVPASARGLAAVTFVAVVLPGRRLWPGRSLEPGLVLESLAVIWVVRRLVAAAGYDIVRQHWRGSDDGFALLVVVTGVAS